MRRWFGTEYGASTGASSAQRDAATPTPQPGFRLRGLAQVRETCTRWQLASAPFGGVQVCSCGHAHLAVGGFTVRLPVEGLAPLRDLLIEAVARLDEAQRSAAREDEARARDEALCALPPLRGALRS